MTMLNENEKFRLLRMVPGANVDDVLEELFSMASDKQRQEFPYGIDVTPRNPKNPPIVMDFSPDVPSTVFRINRGGFSFDLQFNPDNSLSINDAPITEPGGGGGGDGGGTTGGAVAPGRLDGYSGGNMYTVTIFPNGTGQPGSPVSVLQLNGDPAFPHVTDGTVWTMVTKAGTQFFMAIPVWE